MGVFDSLMHLFIGITRRLCYFHARQQGKAKAAVMECNSFAVSLTLYFIRQKSSN